MSSYQLAQINLARAKYDLEDSRMQGFVESIDRINDLAEASPGFIWHFVDASAPIFVPASPIGPSALDQYVGLDKSTDSKSVRLQKHPRPICGSTQAIVRPHRRTIASAVVGAARRAT